MADLDTGKHTSQGVPQTDQIETSFPVKSEMTSVNGVYVNDQETTNTMPRADPKEFDPHCLGSSEESMPSQVCQNGNGESVPSPTIPEGVLIDFGQQEVTSNTCLNGNQAGQQNLVDLETSKTQEGQVLTGVKGCPDELSQLNEQGNGGMHTMNTGDDLVNLEPDVVPVASKEVNYTEQPEPLLTGNQQQVVEAGVVEYPGNVDFLARDSTYTVCKEMEECVATENRTVSRSVVEPPTRFNGEAPEDVTSGSSVKIIESVSTCTVASGNMTNLVQVSEVKEIKGKTEEKSEKSEKPPQKPSSPKKSGVPVRSVSSSKTRAASGSNGKSVVETRTWDSTTTVISPRPQSAMLLSRPTKDIPSPIPRPMSARQSTDKKKYSAGPREDAGSKGSPGARSSPKPAAMPSPKASGVKSKIGSMSNTSHSPGGGNVKITTKKTDYSTVTSKVGSKDKITHKPGGGNVKIENKKVSVESVTSRVGSMDNTKHKAGGGEKKIEVKKLDWKVDSRVGSLDNTKHKPGGGDKKIETKKVEWKVDSKVRSLDNAKHVAGGGEKKIESQKVDFKEKAQSKVGSMNNIKHSPGGGDKMIETQKLTFKEEAKARTDHRTSTGNGNSSREQSHDSQ